MALKISVHVTSVFADLEISTNGLIARKGCFGPEGDPSTQKLIEHNAHLCLRNESSGNFRNDGNAICSLFITGPSLFPCRGEIYLGGVLVLC